MKVAGRCMQPPPSKSSSTPVILKVKKQQWEKVAAEVVCPHFTHSTKLVSPYFIHSDGNAAMRTLHLGGQRAQLSKMQRAAMVGEADMDDYWWRRLGCVKIEAKTEHIRKQLLTGCVVPAAPSNITWGPSMARTFESPRGSRRYKVTFGVEASVVKVGKEVAVDFGGDVGVVWRWVDAKGKMAKVQQHQVFMLALPVLMHYMNRGYRNLSASPFREPPMHEGDVVGHLCNSRHSACCCPWHVALLTKRQNKQMADDAHKNLGRHRSSNLNPFRQASQLGASAP